MIRTAQYSVDVDTIGNVTIKDKNNASVFLQGDDANKIREQLKDALTSQAVNNLCSEYFNQ